MIILGLICFILAIVFALPFFGIGMVIPVLGDFIDIPLSAVFAVAGVVLLLLGGLLGFIVEYWWAAILVFIAYMIIIASKVFVAKKRSE
jgi:hypothetical protein